MDIFCSFCQVLFIHNFPTTQNAISHNVLGIRRFCSPNERNRRFCRATKMWWSKTAQRAFQRLAHARLRFCGTLEAGLSRRKRIPFVRRCKNCYEALAMDGERALILLLFFLLRFLHFH